MFLLSKTGFQGNLYRFSGKEWDSDVGFYYYGYRWYDPETGTWTTKDTIGIFAGDLNVYRMGILKIFVNP